MSKFNGNEFSEVSSAIWKQKIQVDLKGADYNETLLWKTNEGITVKPFYHQDENIQTANISNNTWKIAQYIKVNNVLKANQTAVDAVLKGAESLVFDINVEVNFKQLLTNIDTQNIEIQFLLNHLQESNINELLSLKLSKCYLNIDPIGNLAKTGNWHSNFKEDYQTINNLVNNFTTANILSVDTRIYQNAGATIVQQLAYAMAHANEYLNNFKDKKLPNIQFITATGTNYFFEIAKIRALKLLYKTIQTAYETNTICNVLSFPTTRNKTIYDYNVNMLRTTTECMSAILGGTNTICNLPYDYIYHNSNEFGNRIARNQLLVLKNESMFSAVNNPSDGAYYIESITLQLAEKALEIFKQIEKSGGFLKQLKSGTILRKIKESATQEQQQFNDGTLVLVGTNKLPNKEDIMQHDLQKQPFVKKEARKTLIAPIIAKRLSEKVEQKRLQNEK